MYRHLLADFCRFIKASLVIVVLLQACLTVADHYECDWDPLGSLNPGEAGFTQLCSATPVETVSGTPPWAYYCNVEGANGARQYIVAGFGTRPGELEIALNTNDLDANDLDANDLDANDLDANDLDANDLDANDLDANDLDANDLDANDLDANDLDANDLDANDLDANDLDANDLDANDLDANDLDANDLDANDLDANKATC
ncbi:unnamed protein product [Jaminaea pallidilutea]